MAGNYPDYPSYRIPYDKDGTIGFKIDNVGVVTQMTPTELQNWNDESDSTQAGLIPWGSAGGRRFGLIFPRLMDIDAYFIAVSNNDAKNLEWSPNTTNGYDGTWTTISADPAEEIATKPGYRTSIQSGTVGGVRGIRFGSDGAGLYDAAMYTFHVFGEPSAGENTDMLAIWHPTLDQRVDHAYFDWGNVPRSSSADKQFRVKNLSPTLTAQAPRVALDILTDTTPSVAGWHTISKGGSFAAQQTLGDLGPGAISSELCTLRRTTPSNAILSLWVLRVFAESLTWV